MYIITLALFAIIQIPTALATNIPGLLILRFISGFLGSPALATGGASVGDMCVPSLFAIVDATHSLNTPSPPFLVSHSAPSHSP